VCILPQGIQRHQGQRLQSDCTATAQDGQYQPTQQLTLRRIRTSRYALQVQSSAVSFDSYLTTDSVDHSHTNHHIASSGLVRAVATIAVFRSSQNQVTQAASLCLRSATAIELYRILRPTAERQHSDSARWPVPANQTLALLGADGTSRYALQVQSSAVSFDSYPDNR
jgi:hypothetical protein